MAIFSGLNISASGMSAQRIRMDILAENAANVKTTRGDDNQPYRRKNVVFMEKPATNFSTILNSVTGYRNSYIGNGVKVTEIVEDTKTPMNMVYDPSHPDADENGYVTGPNVNIITEMVDMIDASRAYEANSTAFNASKAMVQRGLELAQQG